MLKFHQIADCQEIIQSNLELASPEISIVLPFLSHFSAEIVINCIQSIQKQSFAEYECIILGANLSEDCIREIKELIKADSRFLWLSHNTELPFACLLNEGILQSRAPYIALNIHGAVWYPEVIEHLLSTSKSKSVEMVYGCLEATNPNQSKDKPDQLSLITIDNTVPVGAILFQAGFFQKYGLFDPHIFARNFYDQELWRRALKLGANIYYLNQALGISNESVLSSIRTKRLDVFETAYLFDDEQLLARRDELQPSAIAYYDLLNFEKILKYVRDIPELEMIEDKYFKAYVSLYPDSIYIPSTKHNRMYDPVINGYSLNPPMAISKPRKRVLLATKSMDRVVEDWKSSLAADRNNIISISSIENLPSILPEDVDCLILFNCFRDDMDKTIRKFRERGVSVQHIISRNNLKETKIDDAQFIKRWKNSTDQVFQVETQFHKTNKPLKEFTLITITLNGLENDKFENFDIQTLKWGIYIGNHTESIQSLLSLALVQNKRHQWDLFISQQIDKSLPSVPDNVRVVYTNTPLNILASHISNYCLLIPDGLIDTLDPYEQLLLAEDAVSFSNQIVPINFAQEISDPTDVGRWRFKHNEKYVKDTTGLHPQARLLFIQNLVLGVELRKKIAHLRGQESASDVKALVLVNSQAIAGAENYGLLVTKGLFNLGFDVQFCTPAEANVFPEGLQTSREWLLKRNLPLPTQADYGWAGYSFWDETFPEELVFLQSKKLGDWLDNKDIGLVFCSAMIPEPLISWREDALTFMSLFAPWEYNLERLTFVGKRVDGLFSDSHWALAPWIEMNPSLNAYAPSMIEREYFQVLNQSLPDSPVQIAIAGTIQPRKRQREAVLAVLHLISKGYNIVLNMYGYQLDSFRSYIQEIEEIISKSEWGDKIKFWGFVEDPHQIAQDNHIILCTSTDESASQSILFNQAAGLLPVSCPAGGLPEIIIDGTTGFLTYGFESQHIAEALQKALDSRETWETLIKNGRSFLLHQCSEPEFMRRILRVMIAAAEIRVSKGAQLFRKVNTARQFHFATRVWLLLKTIIRKNRSWLLPVNSTQERIARYIYFKILQSFFLKGQTNRINSRE